MSGVINSTSCDRGFTFIYLQSRFFSQHRPFGRICRPSVRSKFIIV